MEGPLFVLFAFDGATALKDFLNTVKAVAGAGAGAALVVVVVVEDLFGFQIFA